MRNREGIREISATIWDGGETTGSHIPHYLYRTASLQERFASALVDLLINAYLIGGWSLLLSYFFKKSPLEFSASSQMIWGSTSVAIYFLYHFFFEGVMTATPGKILGGLIIHKKGGGSPSLFACFIRNLFRIVDYPLFFLTGLGMMESTKRCRRLGDIVAETLVLRKLPFQAEAKQKKDLKSGGATLRVLSFFVDFLFLVLFSYGALLVIPVEKGTLSLVLLNLTPLWILLYLTLSETIFHTTLGKVIFGLKIVQEDGEPPSFALVLVRNLFRIFDMNPIGYLCALLSSRKQRPGDIVSGTRVIFGKRGVRGWLTFPYTILVVSLIVTLGWFQPSNFFKKNYQLRVGETRIDLVPSLFKKNWVGELQLDAFSLGGSEFNRGDIVPVTFKISGVRAKNDKAWIQADLTVRDARGNTVLDRSNVINSSVRLNQGEIVELETRFALHPDTVVGDYEITIHVRDRLSKGAIQYRATFKVN